MTTAQPIILNLFRQNLSKYFNIKLLVYGFMDLYGLSFKKNFIFIL